MKNLFLTLIILSVTFSSFDIIADTTYFKQEYIDITSRERITITERNHQKTELSIASSTLLNKQSNDKKTLIYLNGMSTDRSKAIQNHTVIQNLAPSLGVNAQDVYYLYNRNEGVWNSIGQLIRQKGRELYPNAKHKDINLSRMFSMKTSKKPPFLNIQVDFSMEDLINNYVATLNESNYTEDFEVSNMVSQVEYFIENQEEVILLAHSQGNFYANKVWEAIDNRNNNYSDAVGIIALGTPSHYVADTRENMRLQNSEDRVTNLLRTVKTNVLSSNVSIPISSTGDKSGHGIIETYLHPSLAIPRLSNNINNVFNELRIVEIEDFNCTDYFTYGPGVGSFSYVPATGTVSGNIYLTLESFNIANRFIIYDKHGNTLLDTGYFTGKSYPILNYDPETHGVLFVTVQDQPHSDNYDWEFSSNCQ